MWVGWVCGHTIYILGRAQARQLKLCMGSRVLASGYLLLMVTSWKHMGVCYVERSGLSLLIRYRISLMSAISVLGHVDIEGFGYHAVVVCSNRFIAVNLFV